MDYYKIERINFMFIQVCLQIIQKFYYSFIHIFEVFFTPTFESILQL